MKTVIWNFALFAALVIAISSLTGCGGGAGNIGSGNTSANTPANTTENPSNATPEVAQAKSPSEYPPLKADIAQADLKTMDGTTFKIADKKGKVILINLWATWCGPCLAEMPSFVKMQEAYGPQGFEILGIDTDDESDTLMSDINNVIKEKKINYPIVFSDTKTQVALLNISKFSGIPQSFLVDGDGNLRAVFKGANPENVKKMDEIVSGLVSPNKQSE
jgi:thiol-disulfide isomerase/thioredoxin